ncbi:LOW QUALITY PROTEIN: B3 DNA binding domain containing protein [Trema orientale]|uniref:B3 DNA binding domain containing protein n=1 Tax=Trema orientale TaxID=63057 RepID=A0A2P5F335_TREOI|nr:LOW QUALITY PROTEIN: B3 DNA binding domain containing protein [Trema orientale]
MVLLFVAELRKNKSSRGTYKSYKNSRAFEEASSFSSSNPFFIRIHLPDNFIKGHLERKTQIVKLVGMKYWHVKLLNCDSRSFFFGGLSTFVNENASGPSDVCIYELINKKSVVLKVSIFKDNVV